MFLAELKGKPKEIPGVGPKTAGALARAGLETLGDLLQYYPRAYEDRSVPVPLSEALRQPRVNTLVTVDDTEYFGAGPKRTLKVHIHDDTARGVLVCFGRNFLAEKLKPGRRFRLWGSFQQRFGELQSSLFDFEEAAREQAGLPAPPGSLFGRILPVYSLTAELAQPALRRILEQGVNLYGRNLEEEIPQDIRRRRQLLSQGEAIENIHFPGSPKLRDRAAETLKYRELFYLQLMVGRQAWERRQFRRPGRALTGSLLEELLRRLPFSLTEDQKTVFSEIKNDMSAGIPMARLIQGDVGSGKTLMAFIAVLLCKERGQQAAFMAPTEILARQHGDKASELLEPLGIRIAFLGGTIREKNRTYLLEALKNGEIDLLVGTHALFTGDVHFQNLGLVIVDEQQRFGVSQRLSLKEKGDSPDFLLMTATPIPRTMAMTVFGDLDVSLIKTMPPGRKPVETHIARSDRMEKVYAWVRRELAKGRQAYFVYPLIGESEKTGLAAAESMYEKLAREIFPEYPMTLLHSRLPEEEKRERMKRFSAGEFQILAATSVVEVGVDVPGATCMVIANAERFGLSALHQLRGRVGRSELPSYCFLIYGESLSDDGKARLKVMMEESDGFQIAEEDLKIRGPGDLTGVLQSGYLRLKIADITRDGEILKNARADAFGLVEADPGLLAPENACVREVLSRCPPFPEIFLESV